MNERTGVDLEALRREVRATIRDELSAAHAATQTIDEDAETPLPSAAQISNADWAKTVIATAVATGRWTSDDRERLRSMIDGLHPADRDEVLQEWAAAVNEQRLRPETPPI